MFLSRPHWSGYFILGRVERKNFFSFREILLNIFSLSASTVDSANEEKLMQHSPQLAGLDNERQSIFQFHKRRNEINKCEKETLSWPANYHLPKLPASSTMPSNFTKVFFLPFFDWQSETSDFISFFAPFRFFTLRFYVQLLCSSFSALEGPTMGSRQAAFQGSAQLHRSVELDIIYDRIGWGKSSLLSLPKMLFTIGLDPGKVTGHGQLRTRNRKTKETVYQAQKLDVEVFLLLIEKLPLETSFRFKADWIFWEWLWSINVELGSDERLLMQFGLHNRFKHEASITFSTSCCCSSLRFLSWRRLRMHV